MEPCESPIGTLPEMQLTPHYGDDPVIVLGGDPSSVGRPMVRQRQRLAATVADFSDAEWAHPSRCSGWSNRDVLMHLDSTNLFWIQSITGGLGGDPSRFLATFDPVASPALYVDRSRDLSPQEVGSRFATSTATLGALVESLGADDWVRLAEAPPGHVTISAVAHHALWDSWIHERDVLMPLGVEPIVDDDEVTACLCWVAALGPALARSRGVTDHGCLTIRATQPDIDVTVDIGDHVVVGERSTDADLVLTGTAAELVDALSIRRPLDCAVSADVAWMLDGLSMTFDNVACSD